MDRALPRRPGRLATFSPRMSSLSARLFDLLGRTLRALAKVPPFRDPYFRDRVLHGFRSLKARRRYLFERFGSDRYSHPSQFDDRITSYVGSNGPGVFFEAGAFDGYRFSNTYFLERFQGWRGVLVEAMPAAADRCRDERPNSKVFNCAFAICAAGQSPSSIAHHASREALCSLAATQSPSG